MAQAHLLQCHVWLVDSDPPIWRRFQVSDALSLHHLHEVLQLVMGWENKHSYAFKVGSDRYAGPSDQPLEGALNAAAQSLATCKFQVGDQFTYTYDLGDGWLHSISVETISPLTAEVVTPQCLEGELASPPEDSGGIWGYEGLLERLADPEDPEYEALLDWLGCDFDPADFDLERVNQQLAQRR